MNFVFVKFTGIPEIINAHLFETDVTSKWNLPIQTDMLEITALECGGLVKTDVESGEKKIFSEGEAFVSTHCKKEIVDTVGEKHRHVTFSFATQYIEYGLTERNILDYMDKAYDPYSLTAIVPMQMDKEFAGGIDIKIRKIVDCIDIGNAFRNIKIEALVLDILASTTSYSIDLAQGELLGTRHFHHTFYCQQAMMYITAHINEYIDVEKISESMNVSYGHLSRLFKKQTGQTLVEYINREKVRKMEELLWTKRMSVSEVAQCVGIGDEKYASRLFKNYTGLTIGQYIKMNRKDSQVVVRSDAFNAKKHPTNEKNE